jgi:hypothetical protein
MYEPAMTSPERDETTAAGTAAQRLFGHMVRAHWDSRSLAGPDPGIRFNARIGRFIKSAVPKIRWNDDLVYQQAQGYWIMDNWMMSDSSGDARHAEIAVAASESVLAGQNQDGYWPYPNPEWRGRVATVEGCFAALGLLESHRRTGDHRFLQGAVRWHRFMDESIGYRPQQDPSMLAVNYFLHTGGEWGGVPNNSTLALWLLARLWEESGDGRFLDRAPAMVAWLDHCQLSTGELPYRTASRAKDGQDHFLCHQYNAFEFMDLVHYRRITGDESISPVIGRLAEFLAAGVTADGYAAHECSNHTTRVLYYDLALAQALNQATDLGLIDSRDTARAMYRDVIGLQRPDGTFRYHSVRSYRALRDARSYPRYQSMMLHHLLLADAQRLEL